MKYVFIVLTFICGVGLSACNNTDSSSDSATGKDQEKGAGAGSRSISHINNNLYERMKDSASLSSFVSAIKAAKMDSLLQSEGPYTVFAPGNDAFTRLPEGMMKNLLNPQMKAGLENVLGYHIVRGKFRTEDLTEGKRLTTIAGKDIVITIAAGKPTANGYPLINSNMEAANGVLHFVDIVLLPRKR